MCLFLTVPWVGLQCVIVVFPDHTHLLLRYSFCVHLDLLEKELVALHLFYSCSLNACALVSPPHGAMSCFFPKVTIRVR